MILGAIVAIPYSRWSKRRVARQRDDRSDAGGRAMTGGEARRGIR
jgi:hypothetical protein